MSPKVILATVISILTIAGFLIGSVYFLEDRYVDEGEAVVTMQQQQQITDLHLLELWREQKRHLDAEMVKDPGNLTLKERYDTAKDSVKRIEIRLFNQ